MKNAKLLLLSALTIASLSLTSCGDDDSDGGGNIVGKWEYSQSGVAGAGQQMLDDYDHTPGCNKDYIEFLESGTVNDVTYDDDCTADIDADTYVKNGNTLTVGTGEAAETVKVTKLTGSELRLESQYTESGQTVSFVTTFKKAK